MTVRRLPISCKIIVHGPGVPMDRAQPNYARPSVTLPNGVPMFGSTQSRYASGPSFFDRLFGGGAPPQPPQPIRPTRRTAPR